MESKLLKNKINSQLVILIKEIIKKDYASSLMLTMKISINSILNSKLSTFKEGSMLKIGCKTMEKDFLIMETITLVNFITMVSMERVYFCIQQK